MKISYKRLFNYNRKNVKNDLPSWAGHYFYKEGQDMSYERLAKLARRSIGEEFYKKAFTYIYYYTYNIYINYMMDDFYEEFRNSRELKNMVEEMYDLLCDVKFYHGLLELSDDRIEFEKVDFSKLDTNQINDIECTRQMLLDNAIKKFESKTKIDICLEGRSNRHVCIENTLKNALKFDELRQLQKEIKEEYVEKVNEYIRARKVKK
jgi:hypothetical protein